MLIRITELNSNNLSALCKDGHWHEMWQIPEISVLNWKLMKLFGLQKSENESSKVHDKNKRESQRSRISK